MAHSRLCLASFPGSRGEPGNEARLCHCLLLHECNAVLLVWGSLRLAPIICNDGHNTHIFDVSCILVPIVQLGVLMSKATR